MPSYLDTSDPNFQIMRQFHRGRKKKSNLKLISRTIIASAREGVWIYYGSIFEGLQFQPKKTRRKKRIFGKLISEHENMTWQEYEIRFQHSVQCFFSRNKICGHSWACQDDRSEQTLKYRVRVEKKGLSEAAAGKKSVKSLTWNTSKWKKKEFQMLLCPS